VKAVGIQQPKGDDGYAQASCIEQYTFMVTRNIIDDVCLRDERIKLVKKYLRVEFDMHESDEEGDEEFREKLKVEISKIPFKSVPDQNEPRRDIIPVKIENEAEILSGKFGWCFVCRNEASLYCKDSRYPVCSFECKQKILNILDSIDCNTDDSMP
jgi:hypothetical protein